MDARDTWPQAAGASTPDAAPARSAARCLMHVLWPSFLVAGAGTGLLFSLVDPHELVVVQTALGDSREAAYTIGFLLLWAGCAAASGLTWWLSCVARGRDAH